MTEHFCQWASKNLVSRKRPTFDSSPPTIDNARWPAARRAAKGCVIDGAGRGDLIAMILSPRRDNDPTQQARASGLHKEPRF
ncbi:MAG TPA: hypothetical protein VGE07_02395 [Herpetosiphonaceae bacterium]